jgi:choline-sulfatase
MFRNKRKIFFLIIIIIFLSLFFYKKNKLSNDKVLSVGVNQLDELSCPNCNVIIVSLTNTRKDRLGIYNHKQDMSPNIDSFFKESLIFNNAFAPSNWTFVNGVSMFTSLFPYSHKILKRGYNYDSVNINYLADVFRKNNYKTVGFTSDEDYNSQYTLSEGFDFYLDKSRYIDFNINHISGKFDVGAKQLVEPTINWVEENKNNKFFLFLQLFDLHCPHAPEKIFYEKRENNYNGNMDFSKCFMTIESNPPIEKEGEFFWPVVKWDKYLFGPKSDAGNILLSQKDVSQLNFLYDSEIIQADYYLGEFFNKIKDLGLEKNTIIIFISEHGEMLGDKNFFNKALPVGTAFSDKVLNIPFLLKHPKVKTQNKIDGLVQLTDILPTVVSMLKLEDSDSEKRQGKDISKLITKKQEINQYIFSGSERFLDNNYFSGITSVEVIRDNEWKLVKETLLDISNFIEKKKSYNFYNIINDPDEKVDLYEDERVKALEMSKILDQWIQEVKDF